MVITNSRDSLPVFSQHPSSILIGMKFAIVLVLSMLVALAYSQPIFEEDDSEIKGAVDDLSGKEMDEEVQQDENVTEPAELVEAIDDLILHEQGSSDDQTSVDSHSRQKRAVCRCVRRGRRVVCVCRRK